MRIGGNPQNSQRFKKQRGKEWFGTQQRRTSQKRGGNIDRGGVDLQRLRLGLGAGKGGIDADGAPRGQGSR